MRAAIYSHTQARASTVSTYPAVPLPLSAAFGAQLLAATSTFVTAQIVIAAGNPGSHAVWWLCQVSGIVIWCLVLLIVALLV